MKSYRKELVFETQNKVNFLKITGLLKKCLEESGIKDGLLFCNAMHTTASVFVQAGETGLMSDIETWIEGLAPSKPLSRYVHNNYDQNADAHLKRLILGREVTISVTNGLLDLGTTEEVFYGEGDGRRQKKVNIKIIGE